jgi:RHS repeat-associated protein
MKRLCLLIPALVLSCQGAIAQNYAIFHELDAPLSPGQSYEYIARDYIRLKPGFYYNPWSAALQFTGRIEEDGVYPVSYFDDPITVTNRQLNTDLAVGTLVGSQGVSQTGAVTYAIPLSVPRGTAGMEPSLTLNYNSQGGNGMLGVGWSLSGLSAITRAPKTLYLDGVVEGVDFDDDRFALDGNRLMVITGTYGAPGSRYYTEVFNATRVTSYGTSGAGPTYFIAETKDGKTIEYGNTEDSRIEAEGRSDILVWNINRIADKLGNYMEFIYDESPDHTQFRIKEIRYTGNNLVNPALVPYNRIHFYYVDREDRNKLYVEGSSAEQTLLLFRICSFTGDALVRKYEMNYYLDFYSHLIEIIGYGSDGSRYNSTVFEWEDNLSPAAGPQFNSDLHDYFSGDFNGDGKTDLLTAPYEVVNGVKEYASWEILKGPGFQSVAGGSLVHNATKPTSLTVGDYNADGLSDIIMTYCLAGNTDDWYYLKWLSVDQGFEFDYNNTWFWCITGVTGEEYPFDRILTGDLNGDMLEDVVFDLREDYQTSWIAQVMTDDSNIVLTFTGTVNNSDMKVADFTGNGKDDIMLIQKDVWNDESCLIYGHEEAGFVLKHHDGYPTQAHRIFTGDFNGDGRSDVLTWSPANSGIWELQYFTNSGWENITSWPGDYSVDPLASSENYNYHVADFNSDGKSDILESYRVQNGSNFNLFHFNGHSFDKLPILVNVFYPLFDKDMFGDFNGDGNLDLLTSPDYHSYFTIYFNLGKPRHLINAIANGLNEKTAFSYLPLTDETVYTRYSGSFQNSGHEIRDLQCPLYVVSEEISDNGIGGDITVQHSYEGARMHLTGRGFLGFQKIVRSMPLCQSNNFRETLSTYANNPPFYNQVPAEQIERIRKPGSQDEDLSKTTFTYSNKTAYPDNKIFLPYLAFSTSWNYNRNLKSYTENIIDNYGNQTYMIQKSYDENGVSVAGTQTTYGSYIDPGSWCAYLPDYINTVMSRTGEAPFLKSTNYDYNNQGLLITMVDFYGSPKAATTTFSYDGFGNIISKNISASGLDSRTQLSSYDSKGRFAVKNIDVLDEVTFYTSEYTYDPKLGQVIKVKDINGLVTRHYYDGLGRLCKTVFPDKTDEEFSTHWYQGSLDHVVYYTRQTREGRPETQSYHDVLGRERFSRMQNLTGPWTRTETVYTGDGWIEKVSEPYFDPAQPTQWTSYDYHDDGRIDKINHPTHITDYTYNYRETTTTNLSTGISKTEKINSFGEAETVTDPGGAVQYAYYSSGLPKSIIAPDGSAFTMEYDDCGRQTRLTDPDAKTTLYSYNAYGELESHTDAEGNTFTLNYDRLGRMQQKSCNDGMVVSYTFVNEGNGKGQLLSMSSSNGIVYTYEYDDLTRLITEEETIEETLYTSSYTYDEYGNLRDIVYPSGFGIRNQYVKGFLTSVTRLDEQAVLYSNPHYNERGQITSYQLGNWLNCTRTYDQYGFPQSIMAGGGDIQNLEFSFDPATGNLNWRKDHHFNLQETFTFDNTFRNRLTGWYPTVQTYTASYMSNGNLNTKSDVGSYHYEYNMAGGSGGPHSVTSISNPVTLPAESNQAITYTPFNKVKTISHYGQAYNMEFVYGPDDARKKTILVQGEQTEDKAPTLIKTKNFIGNYYEREIDGAGNIRQIHYIMGGDGLLAVYIIERGAGALYYAHKDHLGSLYALTAQNGSIAVYKGQQQRFSFDPWGRRRNPTNWTMTGVPTNYLIDRGFTGHEHLDRLELINMNGRLYDPLLGRFLSPDNYVQAPDNSQAFNRYSYCLNNPLTYVDPEGEFIFTFLAVAFCQPLLPIAIGADIGWISGSVRAANDPEMGFWKGAIKGGLEGAIGGALSMVGGAGMSFTANLGLGIGEGVLTGLLDAAIWKTDAAEGMIYGGISGGLFTTLTSENLSNCMRGNGFKTNAKVFEDFMRDPDMTCQEILDYFRFDAKYKPEKGRGADYVASNDYYGSTNVKSGDISFGNEAYNSYGDFLGTYKKESFTRNRILEGKNLAKWNGHSGIPDLMKMEYFPEEALGFRHVFRNQGLLPKNSINWLNQANAYWIQVYGTPLMKQKAWYYFIYKIPRRW